MALEFVTRQPVLRNAPLTLALTQMRFPRQLGLEEADVRPIQRALVGDYPESSVGQAAEIVVTPAGVAPGAKPEPLFQFSASGGAWTVTLTPSSVSLETTRYRDFTDFATRWDKVIRVVSDELDLTRQDRIGLRYVNEFQCAPAPDPESVRRLVREELVGAVGAHPRTQRLKSSSQELRFEQEVGICTLRHGLVLKGEDAAAYVLDLDFYDDQPTAFDRESQMRILASFNHGAFELFRWAVPEDTFATFRPEERTDD